MGLLKFRAFNKMIKEIRVQKKSQKLAEEYKKIYLEKLNAYGVTDASQLNDEQLSEFLEGMKTYRQKNNIKNEII
jgi:hypothetical protein